MKEKLVLKKSVRKAINKLLLTIIVFLGGMIYLKANPNQKDLLEKKLYEENLPFQKVKLVYEKYFGNILSGDKIVKEVEPVFNEKLTYSKKEKYADGVQLSVSNNYMVPAIESGIIVFIGKKETTGNTIIIEQVDGIDTYYGNITIDNKKLYDYIEKGEYLGEVQNNKLYLAFQKKGEFQDYNKFI